jgi:hypothetical protein
MDKQILKEKIMNRKAGEYCGRPNDSDGSVNTCPGILQEMPYGLYCPICHWHTSNTSEQKPYDYKGRKVEVINSKYTGVLLEFIPISGYPTCFDNGEKGIVPAAIIMFPDGRLEVVRDLSWVKFVN